MARGIPLRSLSSLVDANTRYEPVPDPNLPDESYASSRKSSRLSLVDSLKARRFSVDVKSVGRTAFTQILAILWLAPIITLLYFNFASVIVGAALWCPSGGCSFNPFVADSFQEAIKYSHDARNLLGALQIVAKALEVWFVFIASSLIYTIASFFVVRRAGLPLSLYTAYVEFSDIRIFLAPEFWTSAKSISDGRRERGRKRDWALFAFVTMVAALSVLANLMGPAVAVLGVPRLQQIETPKVNEKLYQALNSESPPTGNSSILYCNARELARRNYNCTSMAYTPALDAWVASGEAYDAQIPYVVSLWPNGTSKGSDEFDVSQALYAISSEWAVSFAFNGSMNDTVFWAPNRQLLRNMTGDLENFYAITNGIDITKETQTGSGKGKTKDDALLEFYDVNATSMYQPVPPDHTFNMLNNSLQTILQRNGPVVGAQINFYQYTNWSRTYIEGTNKTVLCLFGWSPSSAADPQWNATKCLAIGEAWPGGKPWNDTFDNQMTMKGTANYSLSFGLHYASSSVYFNATRPLTLSGFDQQKCLAGHALGTKPPANCDYDALFAADSAATTVPDEFYPYVMGNVHTIFIDVYDGDDISLFAIEFKPMSYIAGYTLDTSPYTNTLRLVELNDLPTDISKADPIYVHPTWLNAMFSSWRDESYNASDPNSYPMTSELSEATNSIYGTLDDIGLAYSNLSAFYQNVTSSDDPYAIYDYRSLFYVSHLTTLHLLSMLPFNFTELPQDTKDQKVLSRQALIEVWSFGLDSRTSIMGVVVALAGCVVVLVYVALGIATRIRVRSPTELLAAGLAHEVVEGELDEAGGNEMRVGRIRFQSDFKHTGWLKYDKVA